MSAIHLDLDQALTPEQVERIAHGASLNLSDRHWQAVDACRDYLDQLIGERRRIYGVTTGYGPLANTYVDTAASAQLQRGLVYHLSSGTGPLYRPHEVRAIMAARAATVAQGHSGIRPQSLQLVLDCLQLDLTPEVPSLGTVGASGDLTPLAHVTLALMGEGNMTVQGQSVPSGEALQAAGLKPLDPEGKDALALVNGTSAMTAMAGLNASRAERTLGLSLVLTALYGELLNGRLEALQPGLTQVRPHPGQSWAQSHLLATCADSERLQAFDNPPPQLPDHLPSGQALLEQPLPQDAYTFRCAPQHLGAVRDTMDFHRQVVERELGSVTDNPVFFPDTRTVLHGGNFFGQHVALAADALNNALITLAVHSERRIARITDPTLNQGLPPFLRGNDNGLHSGFMGAQVTASSLVAELRTHAHPASIQSVPTNANNQDVVTMGTIAARRCADTLDRLHELLAIEAMILTQGMALRGGPAGFATATARLALLVREQVPALTDDRPLADDIRRLSQWLDDPSCPDWLSQSGSTSGDTAESRQSR